MSKQPGESLRVDGECATAPAHCHTGDHLRARCAGWTGRQQSHAHPPLHEPPSYRLAVQLRAARLRMTRVAPVDKDDMARTSPSGRSDLVMRSASCFGSHAGVGKGRGVGTWRSTNIAAGPWGASVRDSLPPRFVRPVGGSGVVVLDRSEQRDIANLKQLPDAWRGLPYPRPNGEQLPHRLISIG
jgi:hypothetical protein